MKIKWDKFVNFQGVKSYTQDLPQDLRICLVTVKCLDGSSIAWMAYEQMVWMMLWIARARGGEGSRAVYYVHPTSRAKRPGQHKTNQSYKILYQSLYKVIIWKTQCSILIIHVGLWMKSIEVIAMIFIIVSNSQYIHKNVFKGQTFNLWKATKY